VGFLSAIFGGNPLNTQLLTMKQIESALNVSHTKIYELINAGEIKTLKIGRRRYARPEALNDFIEQKISEQSGQ
jgi:excisionase family DNA binding protein